MCEWPTCVSGQHPFIAKMLAAQIYDNCLTQAGMLQDFRIMVNRINDLSMMLLQEKRKNPSDPEEEEKPEEPESSTQEEEASVSSEESCDSEAVTRSNPSLNSDDDSYDGAGSFDSAAFSEAESYGAPLANTSARSDVSDYWNGA